MRNLWRWAPAVTAAAAAAGAGGVRPAASVAPLRGLSPEDWGGAPNSTPSHNVSFEGASWTSPFFEGAGGAVGGAGGGAEAGAGGTAAAGGLPESGCSNGGGVGRGRKCPLLRVRDFALRSGRAFVEAVQGDIDGKFPNTWCGSALLLLAGVCASAALIFGEGVVSQGAQQLGELRRLRGVIGGVVLPFVTQTPEVSLAVASLARSGDAKIAAGVVTGRAIYTFGLPFFMAFWGGARTPALQCHCCFEFHETRRAVLAQPALHRAAAVAGVSVVPLAVLQMAARASSRGPAQSSGRGPGRDLGGRELGAGAGLVASLAAGSAAGSVVVGPSRFLHISAAVAAFACYLWSVLWEFRCAGEPEESECSNERYDDPLVFRYKRMQRRFLDKGAAIARAIVAADRRVAERAAAAGKVRCDWLPVMADPQEPALPPKRISGENLRCIPGDRGSGGVFPEELEAWQQGAFLQKSSWRDIFRIGRRNKLTPTHTPGDALLERPISLRASPPSLTAVPPQRLNSAAARADAEVAADEMEALMVTPISYPKSSDEAHVTLVYPRVPTALLAPELEPLHVDEARAEAEEIFASFFARHGTLTMGEALALYARFNGATAMDDFEKLVPDNLRSGSGKKSYVDLHEFVEAVLRGLDVPLRAKRALEDVGTVGQRSHVRIVLRSAKYILIGGCLCSVAADLVVSSVNALGGRLHVPPELLFFYGPPLVNAFADGVGAYYIARHKTHEAVTMALSCVVAGTTTCTTLLFGIIVLFLAKQGAAWDFYGETIAAVAAVAVGSCVLLAKSTLNAGAAFLLLLFSTALLVAMYGHF